MSGLPTGPFAARLTAWPRAIYQRAAVPWETLHRSVHLSASIFCPNYWGQLSARAGTLAGHEVICGDCLGANGQGQNYA